MILLLSWFDGISEKLKKHISGLIEHFPIQLKNTFASYKFLGFQTIQDQSRKLKNGTAYTYVSYH
jgi:ribosomal protein S17E